MAQNDSAFTGSLPRLYDRELGAVMFAPYAEDMARRLSGLSAGRLLETAAGTGIVTQALAAALPISVDILATDLNQPMLDHAATKPGMERVISSRRMLWHCRFRSSPSTWSCASSASCSFRPGGRDARGPPGPETKRAIFVQCLGETC